MDYDAFCTLWHEALAQARLITAPLWPTETVDLRQMDRTYHIYMPIHHRDQAGPFHITTELSWRWSALQSARMATTEEDMLIALLGEEGHEVMTDRPWIRIDVALHATLPAYAPLNVIKLTDGLVSHRKSSGPYSLFARVGTSWSNGLNRLCDHLPKTFQDRQDGDALNE